jgi:hypothetical protein
VDLVSCPATVSGGLTLVGAGVGGAGGTNAGLGVGGLAGCAGVAGR